MTLNQSLSYEECLAQSILQDIPPRAKNLIAGHGSLANAHVIVLADPDGIIRPTYRDRRVSKKSIFKTS